MTKILVTGAAGFIGFHVARRLLDLGHEVVGLDNLNPYYDVSLKRARLARLTPDSAFRFIEGDLADSASTAGLFDTERFPRVIHLAAQPGVRYSLVNPQAYVNSNVVGFLNVLEGCRHSAVEHLVYASSSSVYGANTAMPFSTHGTADHPVSLYAATKKANELMAHTYSHLFRLPTTGLRFFTVYGPWGRPDMAPHLFTKAIVAGEPIQVFNQGRMRRDFTYVDDVVEGVIRVADHIPQSTPTWDAAHPDPATSSAPYRVYNIGHSEPVELQEFIDTLERHIGRSAIRHYREMQPGDAVATYADVSDLERDVGYRPTTSLDVGIARFVDWYCEYYGVRVSTV